MGPFSVPQVAHLQRDFAARLSELMENQRVLVCVGSGGVGKTTTSAAVALRAACAGRRVLVLTVDPARRLANALGLEAMLPEETQVDLDALLPGKRVAGGELWAQMLDTKRTFDRIVERYAPDEVARDRILDNPYYQQLSTALAGSQEYMAIEQLHEIHERRHYDLVVLDTPPNRQALDFLEAPNRIESFFDSRTFRLVLESSRAMGRFGVGLLRANTVLLKGLNRFVGADVFANILEFLQAFSGLTDGFARRAARMRTLLRSRELAFLVVASPHRASLAEAMGLTQRLRSEGMQLGGYVINRVRFRFGAAGDGAQWQDELRDELRIADLAGQPGDEALQERAIDLVGVYNSGADADGRNIEGFCRDVRLAEPVGFVPCLDADICDLSSLYRLSGLLSSSEAPGGVHVFSSDATD